MSRETPSGTSPAQDALKGLWGIRFFATVESVTIPVATSQWQNGDLGSQARLTEEELLHGLGRKV